jgi:RimJ/RimL family protein N-acetyltransferase
MNSPELPVLPIIETPRLILRGWRDEDAEPWIAMNADPRVMEFFQSTLSRAQAEADLAKMRAEFERDGYGWWVVELKESRQFIGVVALVQLTFEAHFTPATEIGWRFTFEAWRKGYATEAATAVMQFAFETRGCDEVVSVTSQLNLRSQRVMRRIGMTRNPADDFQHPRVEEGHRLRPHVLYRLRKPSGDYP